MSGQPYVKSGDVKNFRDEYMKQLGLRSELDKINLDANKIFKATGNLPPQSVADTRTTSEILADVEGLKVKIISELKPLFNASAANTLVQKLQSDPLNADGSFFTWFYQNLPELIAQLKKKYRVGIKGDYNDLEQFVSFMRDTYSRTKELTGSVKTAFTRPDNINKGMSANELNDLMRSYESIYRSILSKYPNASGVLSQKQNEALTIAGFLNEKLNALVPIVSDSRYRQFGNIVNANLRNRFTSPEILEFISSPSFEAYKEYEDLMADLPVVTQVKALLSQLEKSSANSNDTLSTQILFNINEMFPEINMITKVRARMQSNPPPRPPPGSEDGLDTARNSLESYNPEFIDSTNSTVSTDSDLGVPSSRSSRSSRASTDSGLRTSRDEYTTARSVDFADIRRRLTKAQNELSKIEEKEEELTDKLGQAVNDREKLKYEDRLGKLEFKADQKRDEIEEINAVLKEAPTVTGVRWIKPDERSQSEPRGTTLSDTKIVPRRPAPPLPPRPRLLKNAPARSKDSVIDPTAGSGLKRRPGRPKGSGIAFKDRIDETKGIAPVKRYAPFGKYIINHHKLKDDIVSLKSGSGTNVKEFPSSRVSKKLGGIIRTIVGGGTPSFEDLSSLSDEEKHYLYKVSKRSEIGEKLSIPSPSKDQMDKDINQFEIMKGEIMAGNDSKDMIKKFKVLLLKLSKTGTLPKREVSDIMQELLELGY